MPETRLDIQIEAPGLPEGSEALMQRVARSAARIEGVERVTAGVRVVDDVAIHALNKQERGVDRPTDVLSFPTVNYRRGTARDNEKLVAREYDPDTGLRYLGDIVISVDRAKEQALEYGHSLAREIGFLTVHAMLHLFGYDHMTDEERTLMRGMEERIMHDVSLDREGGALSDQELFDRAAAMLDMAYAPYSNYRVGAAILTEDGRVFTGCNVENASYGGTICAERTAAVKAVSEGARRFRAIAIAGERGPAWPCGLCRQVLREFGQDMRVIVGTKEQAFEVTTLNELLPHGFGPEDLGK